MHINSPYSQTLEVSVLSLSFIRTDLRDITSQGLLTLTIGPYYGNRVPN